MQKHIDFEKLLILNNSKDFYIARITMYTGHRKDIAIKECYNLGDEKIVGFDGLVRAIEYPKCTIDTTFLFNLIGDQQRITFQVYSSTSGDYHANGEILILKINGKTIVGYSIDGSDLISEITKIVNTYFICQDNDQKKNLLNLLKYP